MEIEIQQIRKLKGDQFKKLEVALKAAFPDFDELKRMYRYTFDENLTLPNNKSTVYNIIEQAETEDKITALILGAFKENPTNTKLKAFIETIRIDKPSPETPYLSNSSGSFKYFNPSVLITDIIPENIMDLRASKHKDFYYERDFDTTLFELAAAEENILVLGNSLAGKTRAIYELIKKIAITHPKTYVIFPKNRPIDSSIKIPIKEGYRHIAFIEDIDDYYKNDKDIRKNYDQMIKDLVRAKVQIFATCRTGPEYKEYKRLSSGKVKEVFRKIQVGKIKREIIQEFDESVIGDIEQREFDGNIGSIFMDIEKMKERYEELLNATTEEANIAIKIMHALKAFYFASNFTRKSAYDAEAVKDYCLRLCVNKNASVKKMHNNPLSEKFAEQQRSQLQEEMEMFHKTLYAALALLESDEDNLNFIKQIANRLEVEEVYLEKIVKYSPFKIIKDIDKLYDAKEEKRKNGFYVKTNSYNKLLKNLPYPSAMGLFHEMRRKRIMPNADSYSFLIEKAANYETALDWFEKLKRYNIPPNEAVLIGMINKANNFETAFIYVESILDILKKNEKKDADIDYQYQNITYNILNKKLSSNQIEQYLDAYQGRLISISSFVFNEIIDRQTKGVINITTYLKWLDLYQIEPDRVTINVLLNKSSSLQEALGLLKDERFNNITIQEKILKILLSKSFSLEKALALLEDKRFNKIPIQEGILKVLLTKSSSLVQALALLEDKRFNKIPIEVGTLNVLLTKSSSLEQALALLEKEQFNKVLIQEGTLKVLFAKSSSLEQALSLLEKEQFNKIPITEGTFNILLDKPSSLEQALVLLEKERFNKIPINEGTFNVLLDKPSSLEQALVLLEKEQFNKIPITESSINTLLGKSTSLEQALSLLEKEQFNKITIKEYTLRVLLSKTSSLEQALDLLEKERFNKIPITPEVLSSLLSKTSSLEQALGLLKEEQFNETLINEYILRSLISKTSSLEQALDLLEKERFNKIPINIEILRGLLSKSQTIKEVKIVINIFNEKKLKISHEFFQYISNNISFYQDLSSLSFFWNNYNLFPSFVYIDHSFQSFEETIQYFKKFEYKSRFMWNHMLFNILDKALIKNQNNKIEITNWFNEIFEQDEAIGIDEKWDTYIFPDIREMWDSYKFPKE